MLGLSAESGERPRQLAPPGPSPASEGDIVVQLGLCRAFGRAALAWTAEELDIVGDDLVAVALDAFGIRPAAVVDAPSDRDEHALDAMLREHPAEAVEA